LGENTLRKTNVAPKNRPSQKERIVFQSSIFRNYVSFRREGIFAPAVLRHKEGFASRFTLLPRDQDFCKLLGALNYFLRIRPMKTLKLFVGDKFPPSMKK